MTDHDSGYKQLFSHPELVRDLLLGFVPGPWAEQADFSTLERVNASYVSENDKQRHDDMVWRVKVGPDWVWIYLLLEFQSSPDRWMALRMMVYLGLLAQNLVREKRLDENGLLPGIVPIVLYNGADAWKASTEVGDCFAPSLPGLETFRPRLMYHLVDEMRLKLHPVQAVRNLTEAIFLLEKSRTPDDIRRVLEALVELLRNPDIQEVHNLRRSLNLWLLKQLRRKRPEATIDPSLPTLEDENMLQQTLEKFYDDAMAKGVMLGREEGLEKGLKKGLIKGREEGRVEGREEGRATALREAVAFQAGLRFGVPLPDWAQQRLQKADESQLLHWLQAMLTAGSLAELMGDG